MLEYLPISFHQSMLSITVSSEICRCRQYEIEIATHLYKLIRQMLNVQVLATKTPAITLNLHTDLQN
jgi:hypothetical protein